MTSLTPDFSSLNIGKKRGRPRKQLSVPNMDDYPADGSKHEQSKYIHKKTTEMWRYKKLTSDEGAEYRKKELERVKSYQQKKKLEKENNDDSQSDAERQKMLSRER